VCDVSASDGKLEGDAICSVTKTGKPLFEFEYRAGVPVGDLKVYSAAEPGKLLVEAFLDEDGQAQGDATIYFPKTGKIANNSQWEDGKLNGNVETFHPESGKTVLKGIATDGRTSGELWRYSSDGTILWRHMTVKDGKLDGPFEVYDPKTGALVRKSVMANGEDQGLLEDAKKEAAALIAQGYPNYNGLASDILQAKECAEKHIYDPEETRSIAQINESCEVLSAEIVKYRIATQSLGKPSDGLPSVDDEPPQEDGFDPTAGATDTAYESGSNAPNAPTGEMAAWSDPGSLGSSAECIEDKDGAPAFGTQQQNSRFYLCREPIDVYWNDWYGARKAGTSNVLNIVAEGKTSSFDGDLVVDCETGTARWARGSTMMEDNASLAQIREEVPARAVEYARRYVCG
jgi:hypothetical protein